MGIPDRRCLSEASDGGWASCRAKLKSVLLNAFRLRSLGVPMCNALPHAFDLFEEQFRTAEGFFAVLAMLGGTGVLRTHEVAQAEFDATVEEFFAPLTDAAAAFNAKLASLSGLTAASGQVAYFTGTTAMALADTAAYGRSLWSVANEAAFKALARALREAWSLDPRRGAQIASTKGSL